MGMTNTNAMKWTYDQAEEAWYANCRLDEDGYPEGDYRISQPATQRLYSKEYRLRRADGTFLGLFAKFADAKRAARADQENAA